MNVKVEEDSTGRVFANATGGAGKDDITLYMNDYSGDLIRSTLSVLLRHDRRRSQHHDDPHDLVERDRDIDLAQQLRDLAASRAAIISEDAKQDARQIAVRFAFAGRS